MQTVTASMIEADWVAFGVSNTGLSMMVVNALKLASENGATTICITSVPDSPIAQVSKICLLTAPTKRDVPLYGDFLEARMSQLYIIDLLYLGILFRLGDVAKTNLKKNTSALTTYYNLRQ
jgi:RpiR family carbohydrate utilization transcriptional regulator